MQNNDKKVNRRKFLTTGAAAAAGAATIMGAPAVIANPTKSVTWRMQTHWPAGSWYYEPVFQRYADRIKEATNGELIIETHQPNSIVSTGDVLRGVRRGTLESAFLYPAYWVGDIPAAGHLNGNLATWESHEEMHFFLYEMGALDIIRDAYAQRGVYQIGPVSYAGTAIYGNKRIEKVADFSGFQIRSNGNAAQVFQKMGAAPVSISGGELYQALQTGIADGAHWGSVSAGWGMNLQEVNKYIMQPDLLGHMNGEVFVNQKAWDALGSDHKRIVNDATIAASIDSSAIFRHHDFLRMQDFVNDFGGEIVQMDEEVIQQMRLKSLEVVDELSKRDPEYSGKIGPLLHEFMRITGKV
ncbi:TRAP transporter substrate-binding protein [uncultured Marinobacter sp.]|uniref:TRAP transporter substrate-binding protein n=1 Tax=uncultured Marinobacter sp. TaxID=187379 RepID=UPI0030DC656B